MGGAAVVEVGAGELVQLDVHRRDGPDRRVGVVMEVGKCTSDLIQLRTQRTHNKRQVNHDVTSPSQLVQCHQCFPR